MYVMYLVFFEATRSFTCWKLDPLRSAADYRPLVERVKVGLSMSSLVPVGLGCFGWVWCQVMTCQGGVKLFVGRLPVEVHCQSSCKKHWYLPWSAGFSKPVCDSNFVPDDNRSPLSCVWRIWGGSRGQSSQRICFKGFVFKKVRNQIDILWTIWI